MTKRRCAKHASKFARTRVLGYRLSRFATTTYASSILTGFLRRLSSQFTFFVAHLHSSTRHCCYFLYLSSFLGEPQLPSSARGKPSSKPCATHWPRLSERSTGTRSLWLPRPRGRNLATIRLAKRLGMFCFSLENFSIMAACGEFASTQEAKFLCFLRGSLLREPKERLSLCGTGRAAMSSDEGFKTRFGIGKEHDHRGSDFVPPVC